MPKKYTPQNKTAATGATAEFTTGLPTFSGRIPSGLEHLFQSVPTPTTPELTTLPRPGERDPITGRSRTWLVEAAEEARRDGMSFLFRIRQKGKRRGACFLRVPVLLAWIAKREAEDIQADGKGGARHE